MPSDFISLLSSDIDLNSPTSLYSKVVPSDHFVEANGDPKNKEL